MKNLIVIYLILMCFFIISCNQNPDVSEFVTKESLKKRSKECSEKKTKENSVATSYSECFIDFFLEKVDNYCSKNNISSQDCDLVKMRVMKRMDEFLKEQRNEIKDQSEDLQKLMKKINKN